MATPKVYVICDQNCKFEGLTKEQILTAIYNAVNNGTVGNIDAGFISTIKTINGLPLRFFVGEAAEYNALTDAEKENLYAIITNDAAGEGILEAIDSLKTYTDELDRKLFKKPEISQTKTLDGAGYYYISFSGVNLTGVNDGTHFPLGVVYWDGKTPIVSTLDVSLLNNSWFEVYINASGRIRVEKRSGSTSVDLTDYCDIHISKIWG